MSKKDINNKINEQKDIHFWRGFKDLYNDPAFVEEKKNEFIHGVSEAPDVKKMSPISRRKFIALMGASAALAGAACTPYRDKGKIMPYVKGQEGLLPGIANYYASTYNVAGQSYGILVKTREGRPINIIGNPDHPMNRGKIPSHVQASILDLYDPARLQNPQRRNKSDLALYRNVYEKLSWKETDREIIAKLEKAVEENKEIAVISHSNFSPTTQKVYEEFSRTYPSARFYSYEYFDNQNRSNAWAKCYGSKNIPVLHLDKANIIISLDGDFLGTDRNYTSYIAEFAGRRDAIKSTDFNRLYVIESAFTQTGLNADYRLISKADQYEEFLLSMIKTVIEKTGRKIPTQLSAMLDNVSLNEFVHQAGWDKSVTDAMLDDIVRHGQKALFYAGDQQSESVHILVNLLNDMLGATIHYDLSTTYNHFAPDNALSDFGDLSGRMKDGQVSVAIHLDSNPVYHLPVEYHYDKALENVETVISLMQTVNETANLSDYILPLHHPLESWGDASPFSGLYSLQQPVIEPLYNTRQAEAVFMVWYSKEVEKYNQNLYHDFLRGEWEKKVYPAGERTVDFKRFWFVSLHDGVATTKKEKKLQSGFKTDALKDITLHKTKNAGISLIFKPSYMLIDGRYANNGWMQETPHPVTKVTWDNYAAISIATANKLGVDNDQLVNIEANGQKLKLPVFVQPGMADDTIAMEVGYGRKIAGPIGSGVGFDVNILRTIKDKEAGGIVLNGKISRTDGIYKLASTQEHFVFDLEEKAELIQERKLIDLSTLDEYRKNPNVTKEKRHEVFSITDDIKYTGNKWGMAIDLNKCIGCNECITSCNVENNIPVVGKDQVLKGREMHWMRVDRYYYGTPENPQAVLQPMLCQHCDNAPCENVCPVAATVHSPEGLNDMAYNRCVGTRYCANNCPYKVRRFNFFNYRDHVANGYYESDSLALLANPEVTVRSRGVMEKCSMCVQRISQEKDLARKERRDPDGDKIVTACQEACPAEAIVFGDINQKKGKLSKYLDHDLAYYALEQTNVRPNITYITKLRNTHTEDQA